MTGPCSKKHSLLLLAAAAAGAAAVVGLVGACAAQPAQPELPTVEHVILERYAGLWYEIARLPNRFQKQCAGNTTAEYTLTDKEVHVINSCTRADGRTESIEGKARVVPGSGNAKLRVRFFGPFSAPYWIWRWTRTTNGRWWARPTAITCGFLRAHRNCRRRYTSISLNGQRNWDSPPKSFSSRHRPEPCNIPVPIPRSFERVGPCKGGHSWLHSLLAHACLRTVMHEGHALPGCRVGAGSVPHHQYHVVAVDHFGLGGIAQQRLQLAGGLAA